MVAWQPTRRYPGRAYYVPAPGRMAAAGQDGGHLGPLAEPEPVSVPEPQAVSPTYGPGLGAGQDQPATPRGFFLDRYVY